MTSHRKYIFTPGIVGIVDIFGILNLFYEVAGLSLSLHLLESAVGICVCTTGRSKDVRL
jgi:hypothetical protein